MRATATRRARGSRHAPSTSARRTSSRSPRRRARRRAGAPSCAASSPSSQRAGLPLAGARLEISGDVPQGAGLSSSAALEVALCLALLEPDRRTRRADRRALARLCSRVENEWVGAHTGLLDQLAASSARPDAALRIDFHTLEIEPVPLDLDGLAVGRRSTPASATRTRRLRLQRAPRGVRARLRGAGDRVACARPSQGGGGLPEPLRRARRATCIGENERVERMVTALADAATWRRLGAAAGRLAREPARPLRGLHAGGRGGRGQAATRGGGWRAPDRRWLRRLRPRPARTRHPSARRGPDAQTRPRGPTAGPALTHIGTPMKSHPTAHNERDRIALQSTEWL